MGLYHLWAWFGGYLVVALRGPGLTRLLNLAGANGIYLWRIGRYGPDLMVVHVGVEGFRRLRPFCRRTRCRAQILRRRGVPFLLWRLRRRPGLIGGSIFCWLLLLFITNFIWWVEITGLQPREAARVRQILASLGLTPGVGRGKIDKEKLARELQLLFPAAAWVGIEVKGTLAVVRVVRRAMPTPATPADLVAARDGLITKLVVYRGTPVVSEGEMVRRGEVLVYGWEVRPVTQAGTLQRLLVAARAEVEARVWDEAVGMAPLVYWQAAKTGQRAYALAIRVGRWYYRWGPSRPFPWFTQSRRSYGLGKRRNRLPLVEITFDRYDEIKPRILSRSPAVAMRMALREAEENLSRQLPPDRKPYLRRTVHLEEGLVTVILSAETVQEIGLVRPREEPKRFGRGSGT